MVLVLEPLKADFDVVVEVDVGALDEKVLVETTGKCNDVDVDVDVVDVDDDEDEDGAGRTVAATPSFD